MAKQISRYLILLATIFLFSLTFASALTDSNVTLVAPASSGVLSGTTALLNATIDSAPGENWTTAYFYAKSSSTANSSWSLIGTFSNDTEVIFNGTFNSNILQDANDYQINVTIFNGTHRISKVNTGVIVDNNVPTAPTLSPADLSSVTTATTQTFTGTVVDAETTSCTYTIYRGGSSSDGVSGSGSYSGSSCTFTKAFLTSADNGVWWWTITASDGTNSTATSAKLNVNLVGSGSGSLVTYDGINTGDSNNTFLIVLGILIVLFIVLYFKYN